MMNSRQLVTKVMQGERVDRVPIGEYAIDCDMVERLLGHETYLRAKAKSKIAFWEGRRDEVAQSWREDFIALHKKLPVFDIINLAAEVTAILPPKDAPKVGYKKIDDAIYRLENGDVYRYSQATRDFTLVEYGQTPESRIEDYQQEPEIAPVDASCFEVYDALVAVFPEKFIVGAMAAEVGLVALGNTEQSLLRYALEPELIKAVAQYQLKIANAQDKYYVRAGVQGVHFGQDHAYKSGPMISPAMFRDLAMPVYASRVQNIKQLCGAYIFKHACGNNWPLLDMYVEAGFDAYQSVQQSAGMDLAQVKAAYGDKLVLWGGVPLEILQAGTASEVRQAVRNALEVGKPGGRYIFGSSHSIAVGTNYDNFMAMLDEYEKLANC
jgi:hypothetical protein